MLLYIFSVPFNYMLPNQPANQNQLGFGYPCDTCHRVYKWKENLRRHKRLECGKEPKYECNICSFKAKQKSTLQRHQICIHSTIFKSILN